MQIRVGMEGGRRAVLARARELGAPLLVSANSLWRRGRFSGWRAYAGHDVALDSGGFIAMKRYGGFRYTAREYVALAGRMSPTWYAQMDFCCEPEIATDRASVRARVGATVRGLVECRTVAAGEGVAAPMPVLQGWTPDDYCNGPLYDAGEWPALVGVGSVCRRHLHGPTGLLAVVGALNEAVPRHVRFHLFGVKSSALALLNTEFPGRVASVDSMAWNVQGWRDARRAGVPHTNTVRAEAMATWYGRQLAQLPDPQPQQLNLL